MYQNVFINHLKTPGICLVSVWRGQTPSLRTTKLASPVSTEQYGSVFHGTGCIFLHFHCQKATKRYQKTVSAVPILVTLLFWYQAISKGPKRAELHTLQF